MKKSILILAIVLGINSTADAFITKADIVSMLTEVGTSLDMITEVYIGNTVDYYNDGSKKESISKYTKENGNVVSLNETGIKVTYKPDGVITSVYFIPYSSIITFKISKESITLFLLR